jgi:hypothetical protein
MKLRIVAFDPLETTLFIEPTVSFSTLVGSGFKLFAFYIKYTCCLGMFNREQTAVWHFHVAFMLDRGFDIFH